MDPIRIQSFSSKGATPRVQLSREIFEHSGIGIFSTEQIPFADRTGPDFAENLTNLFVSRVKNLQKQGKSFPDKIHIYELGAGTGILARRILDLLKNNYADIYKAVILHITDISQPMITELQTLPDFKKYKNHVVFEVLDFMKPTFTHKPLLIYFTNLLDALPHYRQILIQGGQIFEFQIQTAIKKDAQIVDVSEYPPKVAAEEDIAMILTFPYSPRRLILAPQLLTVLEEQGKFVPIDEVANISRGELEDLKHLVSSQNRTKAFNYSYPIKMAFLQIINELDEGGFIFFSDFGVTSVRNEPNLQLEIGLVMAFSVDFPSFLQYAEIASKTYITSNPQGFPQEMLVDTVRDGEMETLFQKISVNDTRASVNDFLTSVRAIMPQSEKVGRLYHALPENIKSDYVLLNSLALLLHQANLHQEADGYAKVLSQRYGHAVGLIHDLVRGKAAQERGSLKLAEKFFKGAAKGNKGFLAYGYLGELYWKQERYPEYIEVSKEYLKSSKNNDYLKIMFSIAQAQEKLFGKQIAQKTLEELVSLGKKLKTLSESEQEILKQADSALVF